jgi:hypothetical protein
LLSQIKELNRKENGGRRGNKKQDVKKWNSMVKEKEMRCQKNLWT